MSLSNSTKHADINDPNALNYIKNSSMYRYTMSRNVDEIHRISVYNNDGVCIGIIDNTDYIYTPELLVYAAHKVSTYEKYFNNLVNLAIPKSASDLISGYHFRNRVI